MTFRVYRQEWLPAYVADAQGDDGVRECQEYFREKYEGRVHPADSKVMPPDINPDRRVLYLRLHNLKGEFLQLDLAEIHRDKLSYGATIVSTGSVQERELTNYGLRKLPQG
jgi:hypothetical protein